MRSARTKASACAVVLGLAGVASCDAAMDLPGQVETTSAPIQGGVLETGFPAVGIVQNTEGLCSGTLVSKDYVLTAAHCVGTGMVFKTGNTVATAISHPVSAVLRDGANADEVLLRLATPITNIAPFPVNRGFVPSVNTICTAVGFGIHDEPGNSTVGVKRSDTERIIGVSATKITTQFLTGITDSGDSGGALICSGVLVATTSSKLDGDWPAHQQTTYTIVRKGWFFGRVDLKGDVNAAVGSDIALVGTPGATTIPVALTNGAGGFNVTNNAVATFPALAAQSGAKPVSGDFNFDGRADIALVGATGSTTIPVAFSTGNGTYSVTNLMTANFPTLAQAAGAKPVSGDFNGDGRGDIALVGGAGWTSVPVALGAGTAGLFNLVNTPLATFPGFAASANAKPVSGDFNDDGFTDIALVGGFGWATVPLALSNGNGTFTFAQASAAGNFLALASVNNVKAVSGDFNGDGKTDIALTGASAWTSIPVASAIGQQLNIFFQTTNLSVATFPALAAQPNVKAVAGDFNNDGRGDIALTGGVGWASIPVAFSLGQGQFTVTNTAVGTFPGLAANALAKPVGAY